MTNGVVGQMQVTVADSKRIEACRNALEYLHTESSKYYSEQGGQPKAGSQALTEHGTYIRPASISSAWGGSGLLIEYCAEHVTLFLKSLTQPVEILACYTCVRSMMEGAAIAAWLSDPAVDPDERTKRIFAYRYEALEQQLTLARLVGIASDAAKFEAREDEVEQEAIRIGLPKVQNKKDKRIGIGMQMPSATSIIDEVLGLGHMYRMFSSVAHGQHWALTQLGFKKVDVESSIPDMLSFEKTINVNGVVTASLGVFQSFAHPLWNISRFFGWDLLKAEEILEISADTLGLVGDKSVRFWRSS